MLTFNCDSPGVDSGVVVSLDSRGYVVPAVDSDSAIGIACGHSSSHCPHIGGCYHHYYDRIHVVYGRGMCTTDRIYRDCKSPMLAGQKLYASGGWLTTVANGRALGIITEVMGSEISFMWF
jgi:hypothetical protein